MSGSNEGTLRDLVVVEIAQHAAAPLLGMLLADQGARVLKVEPPGGDPERSDPRFAVWNRNKESVVLDLTSGSGQDEAKAIFQATDVVIEDLVPGEAAARGAGYELVRSLAPAVVYCSLPGFPKSSPYRYEHALDDLVGAATGTFQRGPQSTSIGMEPAPLYSPLLLPSTFAALVAAGAVTAALLIRERSGRGQRIEVSLYSAIFAAMGMFLARLRDGKAWSAWEKLPLPAAYACADGRWIQAYGGNRRQLEAMFTAFGHPEWTDDAFAIIEEAPSKAVVDEWRSRFVEMFGSRASLEWEKEISDGDGVSVVCRTFEEFLALPHTEQAQLMVRTDDPTWGRISQLGMAVNLRSNPGSIRRSAPRLGEHGPVAPRPRPTPLKPVDGDVSLPLAGIRVLDLSILLAGPSCGRILGEYGADVIKIDDPSSERRSEWPRTRLMWLDVSRGKRSIRLDLKKPEGREVFWRLLETADVVIENFRAGRWDPVSRARTSPTKLEKLGLGYEDVSKRKPEVVYLSISAFGRYGEFTHRGGYEQAGQAIAGIMVRHGGRESRPLALSYPFNDYGTGLAAAYGVLLALRERNATGRGQHVDTSLASTACLLSARYAFDLDSTTRRELEGPSLLGESWSQRYYKAGDGWIYLHATDDEAWRALGRIEELAALCSDGRFRTADARRASEGALAGEISSVLGTRPRAYWLERLHHSGISAVPHATTVDVASSDVARSAGLVQTSLHPTFGIMDHGGPVAMLSETPPRTGRPAPPDGADANDVLSSLGYGRSQIDLLRSAGVVE